MAKLVFNVEEVRNIYDHAKAALKHSAPIIDYVGPKYEAVYGPAEPALYLVHDQGVYLMSAGLPAQCVKKGEPRQVVAYAKGCNPDKDEDWWENSNYLVGGDDFGELVPLALFDGVETAKSIRVILTENTIRVSMTRPKEGKNS
jgi:hypothetical protein